jgi:hypothetical protein
MCVYSVKWFRREQIPKKHSSDYNTSAYEKFDALITVCVVPKIHTWHEFRAMLFLRHEATRTPMR